MTIKGYQFYIRPVTDPASEWTRASDGTVTNPDFQFTGLSSDTAYEIAAKAVDMAGNESDLSTPLEVSTPFHDPSDDPLNATDAAAIDAIITANKGWAKGAWVSVSGPKGKYSKAYGTDYGGAYNVSPPQAGAALTLDHKFRYGSNTKMYTAVLVFREIDRGHLSLDDTLDQFISGIKNNDKITIRHLLQQTTGIPSYLDYGVGAVNGQYMFLHPTSACDAVALVQGVAGTNSDFEPGTAYAYSNSNSILLGRILEMLDEQYCGSDETPRPVHVIFRDMFAELGLTQTEWPTPNSSGADNYMTPPYSRGYMSNPAWPIMVQTVNSLPLAFLLGWLYWSLVPALSGGWPAQPYMEMTAANTAWSGSSGCLGGTVDDLRLFGESLYRGDLLSEESKLLRKETFNFTYATYTPAAAYQGPGWMGAGLGLMAWGDWRGWIGAWMGYNSCCWFNEKTGAAVATAVSDYQGPSWDLFMRVAYQLYPESTLHPSDWTLRQLEAGASAESDFGGGSIWAWHAPGDGDGDADLPHKVPSYL